MQRLAGLFVRWCGLFGRLMKKSPGMTGCICPETFSASEPLKQKPISIMLRWMCGSVGKRILWKRDMPSCATPTSPHVSGLTVRLSGVVSYIGAICFMPVLYHILLETTQEP